MLYITSFTDPLLINSPSNCLCYKSMLSDYSIFYNSMLSGWSMCYASHWFPYSSLHTHIKRYFWARRVCYARYRCSCWKRSGLLFVTSLWKIGITCICCRGSVGGRDNVHYWMTRENKSIMNTTIIAILKTENQIAHICLKKKSSLYTEVQM